MLSISIRCVARKNQNYIFTGFRIISPFPKLNFFFWALCYLPFRSITWSCMYGFGYYFTKMFFISRRCVACKNGNSVFLDFWNISLFYLFVCLFVTNFNLGHNFWSIGHRDLILGMTVYLIETHILIGHMSRSRSPFKVKGQSKVKFTTFFKCLYLFNHCAQTLETLHAHTSHKCAHFDRSHVMVKVTHQGQRSNLWKFTKICV